MALPRDLVRLLNPRTAVQLARAQRWPEAELRAFAKTAESAWHMARLDALNRLMTQIMSNMINSAGLTKARPEGMVPLALRAPSEERVQLALRAPATIDTMLGAMEEEWPMARAQTAAAPGETVPCAL